MPAQPTKYRCNNCHNEVVAKRPPFICSNPKCRQKKTYEAVEEADTRIICSLKPSGSLSPRTWLQTSPAVATDGRFFVAFPDQVMAVQLEDGGENHQVQWQYQTEGHIPGPPVLGPDGNLRVHSDDGRLHVLNSETGDPCFPPPEIGEPLGHSSPHVDRENVTWISSHHGGLLRIEGKEVTGGRPFFRPRTSLNCTGLIHEGTLYVGAEDYCVYAISLAGTRGENRWNHAVGHGRTGWFINAALAMTHEGTLIVGSADGTIYAFNTDGVLEWEVDIKPGRFEGSPVVDADGSVYVPLTYDREGQPGGHGELLRIDGRAHIIRWRYKTDYAIESTPVIGDDGIVYFGDNGGTVYAVDRQENTVWRAKVPAAVRSPGAIVAPGRVAFGLDDGSLVILRCDSQGLLPTGWPKFLGSAQQSFP